MIRNIELIQQITDQVARLADQGREGIRVVQSKRYIDADILSVGGKWYQVVTSPSYNCTIEVVAKPVKEVAPIYFGEGEASYEGNY